MMISLKQGSASGSASRVGGAFSVFQMLLRHVIGETEAQRESGMLCRASSKQRSRQKYYAPALVIPRRSIIPIFTLVSPSPHATYLHPPSEESLHQTSTCKADSCFFPRPASVHHHGVAKERAAGVRLPCAATRAAFCAHVYRPSCTRPRHLCWPPPPSRNLHHGRTSASRLPGPVKSRQVDRQYSKPMNTR